MQGTMGGRSPKSFATVLLLAIFLGFLGAHRFYVGKIGTGILMLVTVGGLYIWVVIDTLMIILKNFRDADGRLVLPA